MIKQAMMEWFLQIALPLMIFTGVWSAILLLPLPLTDRGHDLQLAFVFATGAMMNALWFGWIAFIKKRTE